MDAWEKLAGIDGVEFHQMTRGDIVRHRLVQDIVNAYEHAEQGNPDAPPAGAAGERPEDVGCVLRTHAVAGNLIFIPLP